MFSKFKVFRKAVPSDKQDALGPQIQPEEAMTAPFDANQDVPADNRPDGSSPAQTDTSLSSETRDRMRRDIELSQSFFSDRARFGIGMVCNAMNPPVALQGFVDFNHYDVNPENPSFWKLKTQSGVMFGQMTEDVVSVYSAHADKNAPFEDSKLGRGLASFGSQFQPEMAKSKPVMTPSGTLPVAQIEEALAFCNAHHVAVAIPVLSRKLPQPVQIEFVSMRRLQTLENGSKRLSLGVRLRTASGVIKSYRVLLDAEKAVLVEHESKVIASIKSDEILAVVAEFRGG